MDSMRSLNTSLPSASRRRPSPQTDIHQDFRSAALSVTNLYKSAVASQAKAHEEGYQEALRDLIGLLDTENLGLQDGEGWRVRRWATERLEGALPTSDSEEEHEENQVRESSPVMERKQSPDVIRTSPPPRAVSPRADSAPPLQTSSANMMSTPDATPPRADFDFRSPLVFPVLQNGETDTSGYSARPPMRVDAVRRSANRQQRHNARTSTNLGSGAGTKRRHPLDFFDISGIWGDKQNGPGNGKRGRFS